MKTIIIPKNFGYPTMQIIANGKHYELKSGEEITVEDHLAEIIENAVALVPKTEKYKSRLAQLAEGSITELTKGDLDGVETIVIYAFRNSNSLKSIEIPDSVTSIGDYAFFSCNSLETLRFGYNSALSNIKINAFDYCSKLERVYLPPKPPTLDNTNAFGNINATCIFYCKTQESLEAYKKATNWSTLTSTYSFVVED